MAQMLRGAEVATGDSALGFDVVLTEADGGPAIDCTEGTLTVDVEMAKSNGNGYDKVSSEKVKVRCERSVGPDIALVVDNSGSEAGTLERVREASGRLMDLVEKAHGRVSLVRVSTEAKVLEPLTADTDQARAALDGLHISNGWTALYDGIRVGNETLGDALLGQQEEARAADSDAFCEFDTQRAILLFTDGHENNSSDQHANERYPGDGVNTNLDDLTRLQTRGITTPIYSVGLGDDVDHDALNVLADQSGGKHHRTESPGAVQELFEHIISYTGPRFKVCTSLPTTGCGTRGVRLTYRWDGKGRKITGTKEAVLNVACPAPAPVGKSATVLLTLSNPGIAREDARELVRRTTTWVSPVANPRVLLVLDNNHHDENSGDAAYVGKALQVAGIRYEYLKEPEHGLDVSALDGFDVVWFSNPGYPMDDQASFDTLRAAIGRGMGVVLQGDDMGWSWGHAFDMSPLTHLTFQDNGTDACGHSSDNNAGEAAYNVQYVPSHAMIGALGGTSFLYGDDIDLTTPKNEGEEVLAWGNVVRRSDGKSLCDTRMPVVVAYDPANATSQ
ncbi:MAG TPA: vWA domain-containing protein [Polyangiaceae bacterium]|nr:vWA domain-containing protein [Polyangiaceae bacterium]